MNWIKKTIIFIGLIIAFTFAYSANGSVVNKIQIEKSDSTFAIDSIHSSVFIEPQANNNLVFTQKTTAFAVAKYFENYLILLPDYKIRSSLNIQANQDINRSEMVSLLLFPFHFFW